MLGTTEFRDTMAPSIVHKLAANALGYSESWVVMLLVGPQAVIPSWRRNDTDIYAWLQVHTTALQIEGPADIVIKRAMKFKHREGHKTRMH